MVVFPPPLDCMVQKDFQEIKKVNNPLISICIPTYNGERYLAESINSVLQQTYQNYEIWIVDDQSKDDTFSIAKNFATLDSRIHVSQNVKNLGLVGNWNRCVELANGEWIKFLFQDDLMTPNCVEQFVSKVDETTFWILCNRAYLFEGGTSSKTQNQYFKLEFKNHFSHLFKGKNQLSQNEICQAVADFSNINIWGEPSCVMIKKDAFSEIGLFDSALKQACDFEFWARLGTHYPLKLIHEKLIHFRVHSNSVTMQNHNENEFEIFFNDYFALINQLVTSSIYKEFNLLTKGKTQLLNFQINSKIRKLKKRVNSNEHENRIKKQFPSLNCFFQITSTKYFISFVKAILYRPNQFFFLLRDKLS